MSNTITQPIYSMSFTSGALLVSETQIAAEAILEYGDWEDAREHVLAENAMQLRSENTQKRIWSEVASRLQTLTAPQLALVQSGEQNDVRLILWLAMCKRYRIIYAFARDVIQPQFEQMVYALPHSAWDAFFHQKAEWHPEVARVAESTRKKQRQIVFKALHQAGLLEAYHIVPTVMSAAVVRAIVEENRNHLYTYPIHPANVMSVK